MPTCVVCAAQCVLGVRQASHDLLPVLVDVIKLCGLAGQLTPDVLTQEDVLQQVVIILNMGHHL